MRGRTGITASARAHPAVTGGTLLSDSTHYYRVFTANGTLTVLNSPLNNVRLLLVGGGSGGRWGSSYGSWFSDNGTVGVLTGIGGGSGGQVLTQTVATLAVGESTVVVGAGGGNTSGGNNSVFIAPNISSIEAEGGDATGGIYTNAYAGNYNAQSGQSYDQRNGFDAWQGFPYFTHLGGDGYAHVVNNNAGGFFPYTPYYMNGGGGAGGHNLDFTGNNSGNGGVGQPASLTQAGSGRGGDQAYGIIEFNVVDPGFGFYGGGAGGSGGGYTEGYDFWGVYHPGTSYLPGSSGPGAGTSAYGTLGSVTSGAPNRGGGGGSSQSTFGNGGSGIVVVKYAKSEVGE
jgi:hypothetical protein